MKWLRVGLVCLGLGSFSATSVQAANCTGPLTVTYSQDGRNYSSSVTFSPQLYRHYVKFKSRDGTPCSLAQFDANSQFCNPQGNCSPLAIRSPWAVGAVHWSDENGVVRVDVSENSNPLAGLSPGNYSAQFREHSTTIISDIINQLNNWLRPFNSFSFAQLYANASWSNSTIVSVTSQAPAPPSTPINIMEYYVSKPGYTYVYSSTNNYNSTSGKTRIQIEEPISWCGFTITPWRFTKDSANVYHFPYRYSTAYSGNPQESNVAMRWMIITPGYQWPTGFSSFNNIFTAIGEKRYYRNDAVTGIRDILDNQLYRVGINGTTSTQFPAYNLGLLSGMTVPYYYYGNYSQYPAIYVKNSIGNTTSCPGVNGSASWYNPSAQPGTWRLRGELMDNLTINGQGYSYSGPALRLDYYEALGVNSVQGLDYPTDNGFLRETWYFVKNVGVVKITQNMFNHISYNTDPNLAPDCANSVDCRTDDIVNPKSESTLDYFYANPTLTTSVSTNGVNYSTTINTVPNQTYHLKVTPPYTGYLEVKNSTTGAINKWLWVENGLVTTQSSSTSNTSSFRVWVPNDSFANETRTITDSQLPWSNAISVNIAVSSISGYDQSQPNTETSNRPKLSILAANGRTIYQKFYNTAGSNAWDNSYIQTIVANMNGLSQTAIRSFNQSQAPAGVRQTVLSVDGANYWYRFWSSVDGWPAWGSPVPVSTLNLPNGATKIANYSQTNGDAETGNRPKITLVSADGSLIYYQFNNNGIWDSNWVTVTVANLGLGVSQIRSFNQTLAPTGQPKQTAVSVDGRNYWIRLWNGTWGVWTQHVSTDLDLPGVNTTLLPMP